MSDLEVKPAVKGVVPPEPCGLLLVDGEHLAYRAFHAYYGPKKMNPTTTKGRSTAVAYGVLTMLKRKLTELNPRMTVICWGGKRADLWRTTVYKEYKGDREVQDPELYKQIDELKAILFNLGFDQLRSATEEADDLIARSVQTWERWALGSVYILTGDHDLRSLIREHVFVVSPNPGGTDILWDVSAIKSMSGVDPSLLPDVYAMVGDDDNIPGVKGIGMVTASKIIEENGPIEKWINDLDKLAVSRAIMDKLKPNVESIKLYKKLMVFDPTRQVNAEFLNGTWNGPVMEQYFQEELEFRKLTVQDFKVGLKYE